QVGKTTVVEQFAGNFEQFISLNLEKTEDQEPFLKFNTVQTLTEAIFFLKNKSLSKKESTLIFLDEIQEMPVAVKMLRYFYEEFPEIPLIAAGSLLETSFNHNISYLVGR